MVVSCGTCPPAPSIASISPSASAGGSQFLLTVNGNDFRRGSVVNWNGSFRLTTFVSGHELVADIWAGNIAQPGTVLVFVFNPPEGGTAFVGDRSEVHNLVQREELKRCFLHDQPVRAASVPVTHPKAVASIVEKFREKYGAKDVMKYYSKLDVALWLKSADTIVGFRVLFTIVVRR